MSLSKIVTEINKSFPDIGGKIYGIATSIMRKRGDVNEIMPGIIDENGQVEYVYVGIDDTEKLIIYHKSNSISVVAKGGSGDQNDLVNTYANSMIVYSDRKRVGMSPDELLLFLEANFPDLVKLDPYKSITIRLATVIMIDQAVFANEYQNTEFKLPANKNLFQMNYTIESSFKKNCFGNCP